MIEILVTPEWLEVHLHDPGLRVVEVDVSPAAYAEGHIDGAVLWNIYSDLKDADYRLVDTAAIRALVERSGIQPDSTVVFYGYGPAIGFWLLKLYGHHDVRLLDAGRDVWREDGRPWSAEPVRPAGTHYPMGDPDEKIRADHHGVRAAISDAGTTLVDVRSAAEFVGERFWPSGAPAADGRAGHVPSARHAPIDALRDDRGAFRSSAEIREVLSPIPAGGDLITYCTIGARASTAWFALTYLLGRDQVRVYDGSWAEWGRMADVPVEIG